MRHGFARSLDRRDSRIAESMPNVQKKAGDPGGNRDFFA
jgi:hypothetical protein